MDNHSRTAAVLITTVVAALCGACKGSVASTEVPNGSGGEYGAGATDRGGAGSTTSNSGVAKPSGMQSSMAGGSSNAPRAGNGVAGGMDEMPSTPKVALPPPGAPGCGLENAAFCDTFDTPSPGGRNGDLNDAHWSAARISTANNTGQGNYNMWGGATAVACGQTKEMVVPPNDMYFCSGGKTESMRFVNSYNDYGGFTVHSYRIRQPFDFSDRTGIITFDVTGQGGIPGGHGFWFNLFISEEPVPAPYQDGGAIALFVKNGISIEFMSSGCQPLSSNALSNIFIEEDHKVVREHPSGGGSKCFKTEDDVLNHGEIHISKDKLEVFMADAGDPSTLRSVKVVEGLNLRFDRGYVSLQHTHYNAAKNTGFPAYATVQWDNIGFDGPKFPTPRGYEMPDNNEPGPGRTDEHATGPFVNTGYVLGTDALPVEKQGILSGDTDAQVMVLKGVDLTNATDALFTLNAWNYCPPDQIKYRFNGGEWRLFQYPFPDCDGDSARTFGMPIDLADLKDGDNTFEMWGDTTTRSYFGIIIANAELIVNVK